MVTGSFVADSLSEDFAGAARIAPPVFCCRDELHALIQAARGMATGMVLDAYLGKRDFPKPGSPD